MNVHILVIVGNWSRTAPWMKFVCDDFAQLILVDGKCEI